jgi:hypothetical protein
MDNFGGREIRNLPVNSVNRVQDLALATFQVVKWSKCLESFAIFGIFHPKIFTGTNVIVNLIIDLASRSIASQ